MSIRAPRRSSSRRRTGLAIGVVVLAATVAFVFSLFGPAAQAFPSGQIGHTGSPDVGAATCANCHQGSDLAASLILDAPTSVTVGETTTITITVQGGPGVVAGFNAAPAAVAGELVSTGAGVQFVQGEVTHTEPRVFSNGQAVFSFVWKAPDEATQVSWYTAAVAGNGDSATTGDAVAITQRTIAVVPAPTPTPTSVPAGVILTPTPVPAAATEPTAVPTQQPQRDDGPFGFALSPQAGSTTVTDPPSESLALTGAEVALPAALSVALFATGAATIVAGRRRQR